MCVCVCRIKQSQRNEVCVCVVCVSVITSMGSTVWPSISFRTGRSSRCMVVTSPSLNLEENLGEGGQFEPFTGQTLKWLINLQQLQNVDMRRKAETDLPARPAICRACDVLMVSICFSPLSLILGFTRLLKMIRFILLRQIIRDKDVSV